jgi:hypothetical protein
MKNNDHIDMILFGFLVLLGILTSFSWMLTGALLIIYGLGLK